jgi:hypothetical protein
MAIKYVLFRKDLIRSSSASVHNIWRMWFGLSFGFLKRPIINSNIGVNLALCTNERLEPTALNGLINKKDLIIERGWAVSCADKILSQLTDDYQRTQKVLMRILRINHPSGSEFQSLDNIFKKILVEDIADQLEFLYLAHSLRHETIGQTFYLSDRDFFLLKQVCYEKNIAIPNWVEYRIYKPNLVSSLYNALLLTAIPLYFMIRWMRNYNNKSRVVQSPVIVRVHSGARGVSTHLNNDGRDNIFQALDSAGINAVMLNERALPDKISGACEVSLDDMLGSHARSSSRKVFLLELLSSIGVLPGLLLEMRNLKPNVVRIIPSLFYTRFLWSLIAQTICPLLVISWNDNGKSSVFRNLVLRCYGVRTLTFSQSWSDYFLLDRACLKFYAKPENCYTNHDYQVDISPLQSSRRLFLQSETRVKFISGPLIPITDQPTEDKFLEFISHYLKKSGASQYIAVFPGSLVDGTISSGHDLSHFLNCVADLLEHPALAYTHIFIKPKSDYSSIVNELLSETKLGSLFMESARVDILPSSVGASLLSRYSMHTIAMGASSVAFDCLAQGRPATLVLSAANIRGSVLEESPMFATHTSEGLINSIMGQSNLSCDAIAGRFFDSSIWQGRKAEAGGGYAEIARIIRQLISDFDSTVGGRRC